MLFRSAFADSAVDSRCSWWQFYLLTVLLFCAAADTASHAAAESIAHAATYSAC